MTYQRGLMARVQTLKQHSGMMKLFQRHLCIVKLVQTMTLLWVLVKKVSQILMNLLVLTLSGMQVIDFS